MEDTALFFILLIWKPSSKQDMSINLDFIECFMTTFLHIHSWLNRVDEMIDEDEVSLKEKPEDARYIEQITST